MSVSTAVISICGKYRYRLTRGASDLLPIVMLNPSTADARVDDPTIKRLLGFAKRGVTVSTGTLGNRTVAYSGIDVVNLYAYRATMPCDLLTAEDPYGPENDKYLHAFCKQYAEHRIVVGWGVHAQNDVQSRFLDIAACYIDSPRRLMCFGHNLNGTPKHPLYLSYKTPLVPYPR